MFQEQGWLAQADARAVQPADSVNGTDHRGDGPGTPEPSPRKHPSWWQRLVGGFPWHERTQRSR